MGGDMARPTEEGAELQKQLSLFKSRKQRVRNDIQPMQQFRRGTDRRYQEVTDEDDGYDDDGYGVEGHD